MPSSLFNFTRHFKKNPVPVPVAVSDSAPKDDQPSGAIQTSLPVADPTNPAIDATKRVGMDILSRLTQRTNKALMAAVDKAKELKIQYVDTEHILWGLLQDGGIYQLISDCKAVPGDLQQAIEKSFKQGSFTDQPHFSPRVKRVLELSLSAAKALGYEFISPEHLLLALSKEGEGMAAQTMSKMNLKLEVLNQKITGKKEGAEEEKKKESTLEQYTQDLTAKANAGELDPVVGRSWEIERIIHILSRRTKNNPVLIGDAGVGKTAIIEGLAYKIAHGDVPETMLHKRILSLDLMSLIAGARHRGEFEERLKNLIKEVKAASGGIILFIDELHNMVGAGSGGEGTMDASNILKPSLARGELQTIGTTTVTEYRKYIEKDPALERRFQPVLVNEPTAEVAIQMLMAIRDKYEAFHRVKISDDAIEEAVKLSQRYIGDRFLPDKAVDLIDEGAASVRLPAISLPEEIKDTQDKLKRLGIETQDTQKSGDSLQMDKISRETEELNKKLTNLQEQYEIKKSTTTNIVTPDIIADIVSKWTNIPVSRLSESDSAKLIDLENIIHKRLIDQEEAVQAVAEAVRRGRAGLKSNKRPIGSFIFMGPTGVGKTELAKALAEILFGAEEMMVRLDMTEYMEKHEVAKLIGAPPGYVGYDEGGQLTEAVRRRPYSVVLFDEIEKAHPDVFNILIQLLDDGRLTDNKGHTISFKNTIVICTSNLGSGIIQEELLKNQNSLPQQDSADGGTDSIPIKSGQIAQPKADQPMAENSQVKTQNGGDNSDDSVPDSLNTSWDGQDIKQAQTAPSSIVEKPDQNGPQTEGDEVVFQRMTGRLMEELKKFFRPELLNRFDEVVVFRPLSREHMKEIVALQIKGLIKMLEEKNMRIRVTDEASAYLAEQGYDPVYGARPLRRALQRLVENEISSMIIRGELKEGETISVEAKDEELSFQVEGRIKDIPPPVAEPKTAEDANPPTPEARLADLLSASSEDQSAGFPTANGDSSKLKQPSPAL